MESEITDEEDVDGLLELILAKLFEFFVITFASSISEPH
jgi:hypothetical protein